MRVTIVPEDGLVAINDNGYSNLDLSFVPKDVHAVQWYGDNGEVEYKDSNGMATYNQSITSLNYLWYFDQCYQAWQEANSKAVK